MSLKHIVAGSALAAAGLGTPAYASPAEIKVGIVDVKVDSLAERDRHTVVEYREYAEAGKTSARWETESGRDHGQLVASAFVQQLRGIDRDVPIRIYGANVFQEKQAVTVNDYMHSESSKRTLSVNWSGAQKALDWFKEHGVRVVLTSFTSPDTPELRAFMKTAQQYGMTVFASAGNKLGGMSYPAAYPQSVSVAGDDKSIAFRKDPTVASWVNLVTDASSPEGPITGPSADLGSSFAVARAAAYGAWAAAVSPDALGETLVAIVKSVSKQRSYDIRGVQVTASYLDPKLSAAEMREMTPTTMQSMTEIGSGMALAASKPLAPASRAGALLAMAGGMSR